MKGSPYIHVHVYVRVSLATGPWKLAAKNSQRMCRASRILTYIPVGFDNMPNIKKSQTFVLWSLQLSLRRFSSSALPRHNTDSFSLGLELYMSRSFYTIADKVDLWHFQEFFYSRCV